MTETNEDVEFMTRAKFSKLVEQTVREYQMSHMDAVIHLCEQYQIELEDCKKFVSKVIKEKLEVEAMNLNFIEKSNSLPI